jgi:hypothetical protein
MRFGKNPNEPETGVNLREHVVRTDTDGYASAARAVLLLGG